MTNTLIIILIAVFAADLVACLVYLTKTGRINFRKIFETKSCSGTCNQGRTECDCSND